ncbi:MAG: STAS domain-containing protein [Pseudonocardiaceae bacterium]|nr:STAS domain-containing protein [Pseudonocardiaceae bacterium]
MLHAGYPRSVAPNRGFGNQRRSWRGGRRSTSTVRRSRCSGRRALTPGPARPARGAIVRLFGRWTVGIVTVVAPDPGDRSRRRAGRNAAVSVRHGDAPAGAEELPRLDVGGHQAPAAACSCTTESLPSPAGELTVLRVGGEVDLLTTPVLRAALDYHLDRRPAHLLVDLARLRFCSARGMGLLVHARVTATKRGIEYAISAVPSRLGRLWDELWPGELPDCYPSTAAAVAALRAHHVPRPD